MNCPLCGFVNTTFRHHSQKIPEMIMEIHILQFPQAGERVTRVRSGPLPNPVQTKPTNGMRYCRLAQPS